MVHHLRSGLEAILAPDCTLVVETARSVNFFLAQKFLIILSHAQVHARPKEGAKISV